MVAAGSVEWSLGGSTAQDPRQEARENKCYQDRRVCVSPKKAGIWGQFRARGDGQPGGGPDSRDGRRLDAVGLVVQCGPQWRASGSGRRASVVAWREGSRRQWWLSAAHDGNNAKLEHAGRKQVNAGLMGISIAALKQSCKRWKAVRAIL